MLSVNVKRSKKQSRRSVVRRSPGTQAGNLVRGRGPMSSLSSVVEPWMPLFPVKTTKRLRYSTFSSIANSSGIPTAHVFRINDLYDIDVTSTGHQPMGFDQMMLYYEHFVVTKAKVRCTFRQRTDSRETVICLRVDADVTPLTVADRILEIGGCIHDTLGSQRTFGADKTLEMDVDMARFQGVSPAALTADAGARGSVASSPSEGTYLHVQVWNNTGVAEAVQFEIIIEQEAHFIEPRNIVPSLKLVEHASKKEEQKSEMDWVSTDPMDLGEGPTHLKIPVPKRKQCTCN